MKKFIHVFQPPPNLIRSYLRDYTMAMFEALRDHEQKPSQSRMSVKGAIGGTRSLGIRFTCLQHNSMRPTQRSVRWSAPQ